MSEKLLLIVLVLLLLIIMHTNIYIVSYCYSLLHTSCKLSISPFNFIQPFHHSGWWWSPGGGGVEFEVRVGIIGIIGMMVIIGVWRGRG